MVRLSNAAGDSATVSLYGAQVLSWCTAVGGSHLYCSPQAMLPGRAVRGGVPVCFPQFANCGRLVKHGFARTSTWQLQGEPITGANVQVASASFTLQDSLLTRTMWPFRFALLMQVRLGAGFIECSLHVSNTGVDAFDFTAALHTYLAIPDLHLAALRGLAAVPYYDALRQNAETTSSASLLHVTDEVDHIYLDPPTRLELLSGGLPHLCIEQTGFADTVVWNPGLAKAASLGDMPADDWQCMLCVEAAQIKHPVHLLSGEGWHGMQRLTLVGQQA
jgi:glucose-6-phosphate 1-epimerase